MSENWFFLRGLVRESGHWNEFPKLFQEKFPDRKVILLDLPGNGAYYQKQSPSTVSELADHVRQDFLRTPRADKNFIFAISLGAMVAMEWLQSHPNDVNAAVLINSSLRGLSPFYDRLRPQNYLTILTLLFSNDLHHREKEILRITSNKPKVHEAISLAWTKLQQQHPVSKRNAIQQIFAAMKYKPKPLKPNIPLLILNGLGDRLVHPRCSEKLASFWSAPIMKHPSAGHDLCLDEPEWVLEQLELWTKNL